MSMEEKLAKYRAQKRREELWANFKSKIRKMILPVAFDLKDTEINIPEETQVKERPASPESLVSSSDSDEGPSQPKRPKTWIDYVTYVVYFLFWATLYAIAIELKFGTVFFMFSCLAGIYLNTRTGPKLANEPSAYSVFNPNVESIDGTLKAEQFEREIGLRVK